MIVKPRLSEIIDERKKNDPSFNQRKVALLSGLTEGTISRFDRQSRYEITNLFKIADALNVKIEDLFQVTSDGQ
jgi:transcriptional regulator with XRE-family HTH domain